MKIGKNKVVTLEYTLMKDSGEIIESSKEDGSYEYIYGTGDMLPGVEKALLGLQKGEQIDITIPPEEGFGLRDENLIEEIDVDQFPDGAEIEEGMEFDVEDEDGESIITILERTGNRVKVDSNHPLAGKILKVTATVIDVREADPSEIAHHHAHHHHDHGECDHDNCEHDDCTCGHDH